MRLVALIVLVNAAWIGVACSADASIVRFLSDPDTVIVTDTVIDTILVTDTLIQTDTIIQTDTLIITDTLIVTDTICGCDY